MQQRFHLFVRRYPGRPRQPGWWVVSVLTHPQYAVVGRDLSALRLELSEVLARDLALKHLPHQEVFFEDLEVEQLQLELLAVQHARLVRVPMAFTLCVHASGEDHFTVTVPRLELTFSLRGRRYLRDWTIERIRGALHLREVRQLLALRPAQRERVETLLVRWHGAGRYKKQQRGKRVAKVAAVALEQPPTLAGIGVELVEEARRGRLPRALERGAEVDRLVAAISRRRRRAALLVGEPGVGKTALVYELAHRIAAGRVPERLRDAPVWWISGNQLMAGMMYLGQWQQRALSIARTLSAEAGVLYFGGLVELLQAGSGRGGLNAGQLFLPFLDRDAFPVIAEVTPDGLVRAEQLHSSFVRALQRLELQGMARDQAFEVLEILAHRMARGTGTTVTEEALDATLEILARFGQADALPGSGLALVERMVKINPRRVLGRGQAVEAFTDATGFPPVLVDFEAPLSEDAVRQHFQERIIGQPEPTRILTHLILVLKAGLNDPSKPLGSLLLLGPTGVGKTESAKALASWLFGSDDRLVRFDMSEYAAHGSAARLVQGPGGQGLLTRRVREQPFGVVLFDEIEKAEPGVFDVLLQVMGEGRLTDGTGVTVSFRHTIVLLTSNLGADSRASVGLVEPGQGEVDRRYRKAAEAFFRPEFINRLDAIVPFHPLSEASIRVIAEGLLSEALSREGLRRRGVTVAWGPDVLDHLVEVGYRPSLGARPMRRAIETEVLVPLARVLALGVPQGTALSLAVVDGRIGVVR